MSSPFIGLIRPHESLPELPSSSPPPTLAAIAAMGPQKPKRAPPITPKRFTRFFTPRASTHGSSSISHGSSARQLQDITRAAINRGRNASSRTTPRKTVNFADAMVENSIQTPKSHTRKRKTPYLSPDTSPAQSSPSKRLRFITPPFDILEDDDEPHMHIEPIRRLKSLGGTSRILQRSFGGATGIGRGFHRDHCISWQEQTANFYSGSDDCHQLPRESPPFCIASCNSKPRIPLMAILY